MMSFEEAHNAFVQHHLQRRKGERKRRLEVGHAHAEILFCRNVWWALFGHFHDLHPEYEVRDWRGRSYFADFAWLKPFVRLIIEIKGYQTHVLDMDRHKFSNECNREAYLTGIGFEVISFTYDDVKHRPDVCINLLRIIMSKYQHAPGPVSQPQIIEKEVIRLTAARSGKIRTKDVCEHFQVDFRTARKWLSALADKGWLRPVYSGQRIRVVYYELSGNVLDYLI